MASAREQAVAALEARLKTVTGLTVERNRADPLDAIPAGGAAVLYDPPEPDELVETIFSPARYVLEATLDCEVAVRPGASAAATRTALDALLEAIGTAVNGGDRSLGGLAEWIEAGAAAFTVAREEGTERFEAALVPITVQYITSDPLGT